MLTVPERIFRRVLNAQGLRSRFLATRVGRMHVLDSTGSGSLPPIVVLHGLSANALCYAGLLQRFAPHCRRVIAPDMPAHGFSDVPTGGLTDQAMVTALGEVLDRVLGETNEPAILVGNSMGGLAAVRYANARPERVAGLALVSPGGAPMPAAQFAQFLRTFEISTHREALRFVDAVFANGAGVLRHALAHGIRQRFTHPQLRQLLASITPEHMLRPEELSGLRMPTMLIWGREERVLPRTHLEFFRRHLPTHSEIEEWPNFGHIGFLEQPAALSDRILGFAGAAAAGAKNLSRRSTGCGDYATLRASA
jgi:pimeloyl-ACP methyl ester carboxylesterase